MAGVAQRHLGHGDRRLQRDVAEQFHLHAQPVVLDFLGQLALQVRLQRSPPRRRGRCCRAPRRSAAGSRWSAGSAPVEAAESRLRASRSARRRDRRQSCARSASRTSCVMGGSFGGNTSPSALRSDAIGSASRIIWVTGRGHPPPRSARRSGRCARPLRPARRCRFPGACRRRVGDAPGQAEKEAALFLHAEAADAGIDGRTAVSSACRPGGAPARSTVNALCRSSSAIIWSRHAAAVGDQFPFAFRFGAVQSQTGNGQNASPTLRAATRRVATCRLAFCATVAPEFGEVSARVNSKSV